MNQSDEQSRQRSNSLGSLQNLLLILVCFVVVYALIRPRPVGPDGPNHAGVGKALTKQSFQPLTGAETAETSESLQGKVVLVNYWGTWCAPCRREFPHIMELRERFQSRDEFQLISVSCNGGLDRDVESLRDSTEKSLKQVNANVDTYLDVQWVSRTELGEVAGIEEFGFPTTVLLDRRGKIAAIWQGYHRGVEVEMEMLVKHALNH